MTQGGTFLGHETKKCVKLLGFFTRFHRRTSLSKSRTINYNGLCAKLQFYLLKALEQKSKKGWHDTITITSFIVDDVFISHSL